MKFTVSVQTNFNCTIERAFKSAILCDVTKIHTGFGLMPKVTHVSDDESWGQIGSSKKIYVSKSISQKGGFASIDHILERKENSMWTIEVNSFQSWMLGFYKFVGTWKTTEFGPNNIQIDYSYDLHSNSFLLIPLNWLFAKLFWKKYMKRVLENIRTLVQHEEPYMYN